MADYKIVQCFGVKRRPHKAAKYCRRRYLWTAGALVNRFGGRGVQACPYCGTLPDFRHPYNRHLAGEFSEEEAADMMPDYLKLLENENNT